VVCPCNPSTGEAEAGESRVKFSLGYVERQSQKTKQTKNEWVNCIFCELYLNKAVFKT
jgi:hypothetical protein